MAIAIYPGSFDPITNGHIDVLDRASKIFERVIVVVLANTSKNCLFSMEDRLEMIEEAVKSYPNVAIDSYRGLTAHYAEQHGANLLIRGLRAVSDFDAELRIALTNKKLNPSLETIFLMTSPEYLFLSSSTVKEIASMGGCTGGMVPVAIEERLRIKYQREE
ncbi:MAG TPA: pantetheine-phosphate adenylyltransferase [Cyanobacteria bacterium UBA8530]|nr:pantetheine-phosphate adenylyltransferase [Cyanobacteria bacterium UBA8530]